MLFKILEGKKVTIQYVFMTKTLGTLVTKENFYNLIKGINKKNYTNIKLGKNFGNKTRVFALIYFYSTLC